MLVLKASYPQLIIFYNASVQKWNGATICQWNVQLVCDNVVWILVKYFTQLLLFRVWASYSKQYQLCKVLSDWMLPDHRFRRTFVVTGCNNKGSSESSDYWTIFAHTMSEYCSIITSDKDKSMNITRLFQALCTFRSCNPVMD